MTSIEDHNFGNEQVTPPGMISVSYARALSRTLAEHGFDVNALLAQENLTTKYLENHPHLSAASFGRLYQQAMVLLKDESLGMVSGGKVASGTFRMLCLCVIHCSNLEKIIKRASEFFDVCNSVLVKPKIVEGNTTSSIVFSTVKGSHDLTVDEILTAAGPVKVRTSLFMWQSLLSWFAGKKIPLVSVEFNFAEPENGQRWSQLFGCKVLFGCEHSLLRVNRETLALPNVQTEETLTTFLKTAPYQLIVPTYHEQSLSNRVSSLLEQELSQGLPNANDVGKRLGMSVSTLRRQLSAEGTSFQQLKDDCRRAAAMQYLASNSLSVTEVAGLLGFDESSAFFRSFKRWTGQTPSQYRSSLNSD